MTSDNNGGRTGGMRGAGVGKEGANMGGRDAKGIVLHTLIFKTNLNYNPIINI